MLAPLLPAPSSIGRPWRCPLRAVFDGILYGLRKGYAWRHLPLELPLWRAVHRWFLRLLQTGVFERFVHALTMADLHDSHGAIALLRDSRALLSFLAHCRMARDF